MADKQYVMHETWIDRVTGRVYPAGSRAIIPDPKAQSRLEAKPGRASEQTQFASSGKAMLQQSEPGFVDAADFGVVYDTDDAATRYSNTSNLNDMLQYAKINGYGVRQRPRRIHVDLSGGPVLIPSSVPYDGQGGEIVSATDDRPVMASESWLSGMPGGRTEIRNLILRGTGSGSRQHGLILRDYYSRIENVECIDMGGNGHLATHLDAAGQPVNGTLVENRWVDCAARNCRAEGFLLGAPGNGKITDGYLVNPIVAQPQGVTASPILVGAAAGWKIDGVHTYGGDPEVGCALVSAYNTEIGTVYIETFTRFAVSLGGGLKSCRIGSIMSWGNRVSASDAAVLNVEKSDSAPVFVVSVDHIFHDTGAGGHLDLVRNAFGSSVAIRLGGWHVRDVQGAGVDLPGPEDVTIYRAPLLRVDSDLYDDAGRGQLVYRETQLTGGEAQPWNGNDVQTVDITMPYLSPRTLNRKVHGLVSIVAHRFDNGPRRCHYVGLLVLSAKTGSEDWRADLIDIVPPSGFAATPVLASPLIAATPPAATARIIFQATDADAYGALSVSWGSPTT